jgi:hypothetical protein
MKTEKAWLDEISSRLNTAALALPPGELHQLFIQIRRTMS